MTIMPRSKAEEILAAMKRNSPLQLLDLPVDVLQIIMKEITHTNDLTSLALTHSALHNLAIPYIYSRFDIVWPDGPSLGETRSGVDALTYGLSTLVMSTAVFGDSHAHTQQETAPYTCVHCGETNYKVAKTVQCRNRKGNYFAQYTRKFSLGNGPPKWVKKYLISKESGKMLGTLVALAIARMPKLETFMWDMPTGILRDVWVALSSLGDRPDGQESRLERIWIRWHDNQVILALPRGHEQASLPHSTSVSQSSATGAPLGIRMPNSLNRPLTLLERSYKNIEHPNLSILPPLKSVTVLDIDEPAYLNELSILIERSIDRLRELRIGTASVPMAKTWSTLDQNPTATPNNIDPKVSYLTSGGILGLIMSGFYDCRGRAYPLSPIVKESQSAVKHVGAHEVVSTVVDSEVAPEAQDDTVLNHPVDLQESPDRLKAMSSANDQIPGRDVSAPIPTPCSLPSAIGATLSAVDDLPVLMQASEASDFPSSTLAITPAKFQRNSHHKSIPSHNAKQVLHEHSLPSHKTTTLLCSPSKPRKLRLETLELERVPINTMVLQKTIDWSLLTSLTLLNCESDEELWKALRRTYSPRSKPIPIPSSTRSMKGTPDSRLRKSLSSNFSSAPPLEYRLKLRRIHTNNVTPGLISFLKEALAPNSLEWLFLQEAGSASGSMVTLDTIYRGPLRRHRASLTKLMIDSTEHREGGGSGLLKAKMWMLNREILTFITSGKMTRLRELAMVISFKEWHFFLQRLPQIPHLRSLYIPYVFNHPYDTPQWPKELALQVVDIVTLRSDIEICYLGISGKCFEVLENRNFDDSTNSIHESASSPAGTGDPDEDSDTDEDDDDDDNDDDDDDDDEEATFPLAHTPSGDQEEDDSEDADDSDITSEDDEDGPEEGKKRPKLKLMEILFYDDKVSIFKARHGQL